MIGGFMCGSAVDIGSESINQPESATEEYLILAAQSGGRFAYAELCRRCRKSVFHVVHRITKNNEDTEDAIQDAWMRGFIHIKSFDSRAAFSSWLTRIAINSALLILRKKRRQMEISMTDHLDDDDGAIPDIVEPSRGPEERCIRSEREMLLRRAVQRLPASLRTVVEVHHSQALSMREIATTIGISVPAVKSRLARARNELCKRLSSSHREKH
jgi:RNA polymerase sigma-70 factor, ECF subfamily